MCSAWRVYNVYLGMFVLIVEILHVVKLQAQPEVGALHLCAVLDPFSG